MRRGIEFGIADSGATDHLHDSSYNSCLSNTKPSSALYATAGEGHISGDLESDMDVTVLNLDHQPNCPPHVDHTLHTTTVNGLGHNLWSLEAEFRDNGYDMYLRHGYKPGDFTGMYRPPEAKSYGPESFIPMV